MMNSKQYVIALALSIHLLLPMIVWAQTAEIDRLERSIASTPAGDRAKIDTLRRRLADALHEHAMQLIQHHRQDSARILLTRSLRLCETLRDSSGIDRNCYRMGEVLQGLGKLDSAETLYQHSLDIRMALGRHEAAAYALSAIGGVYATRGEYPTAISYYGKSLELRRSISDQSGMAYMHTNLGSILTNLGRHDDALRQLDSARMLFGALNDHKGSANILTNIGNLYYVQGAYDSAVAYYERAIPLREEIGDRIGLAKALNNIGACWFQRGNTKNALQYYNRVLRIREEEQDLPGLITTHMNMGMLQAMTGAYADARMHLEQSLQLADSLGDARRRAHIVLELGSLHDKIGAYPQALSRYLQALDLMRKLGDRYGEARAMHEVGLVHSQMNDLDGAADFWRRALRIHQELNNVSGILLLRLKLAGLKAQRGELAAARAEFLSSLAQADSTGEMYSAGLALEDLGRLSADGGDDVTAMYYYRRGLALFEQIGDPKEVAYLNCAMAEILSERGAIDSAAMLAKQSLVASEAIGSLPEMRDATSLLSRIEAQRGNFMAAYEHHRKLKQFDDSLFSEENTRHINRLRAEYDYSVQQERITTLERDERIHALELARQSDELLRRQLEQERARQRIHILSQEKEIQALQLDSSRTAYRIEQMNHQRAAKEAENLRQREALSLSEIERQQFLVYALVSGVLMLLVIGVLLQRRARAKRLHAALRAETAELRARAAEAESHKLAAQHAQQETEAQQRFARGLLRAQEDERARIANDLHDSLGQELVVIKNRTLMALRNLDDPDALQAQLKHVLTRSDAVIQSMRAISHNLRPLEIDRVGFTETVRGILKDIMDVTSLRVQSEIMPLDQVFTKDEQITLFRIIQEALVNAVKHADASTLTLRMLQQNGSILVEIRDDGKGFDPAGIQEPGSSGENGFGIRGMAERVRMLQGGFTVRSRPGKGTVISITLHEDERERVSPGDTPSITSAVHHTEASQ